jgi:hypothetical protein
MSNLIGHVEPMALANHPVKGLHFIMSGAPEVTIILSLACYLKTILDSNFFTAHNKMCQYFFEEVKLVHPNWYSNLRP